MDDPLDILDKEMNVADERLEHDVSAMVTYMHECSTTKLIQQAERLDRLMHSLGFECAHCDEWPMED